MSIKYRVRTGPQNLTTFFLNMLKYNFQHSVMSKLKSIKTFMSIKS